MILLIAKSLDGISGHVRASARPYSGCQDGDSGLTQVELYVRDFVFIDLQAPLPFTSFVTAGQQGENTDDERMCSITIGCGHRASNGSLPLPSALVSVLLCNAVFISTLYIGNRVYDLQFKRWARSDGV
ncbi:hypothetical protein BU17DRAFT_69616 [Hysterangium stoloniferum]|nr:hypothetical protein BU17DRAFT_69616 [Hysterangium stoloniferum]